MRHADGGAELSRARRVRARRSHHTRAARTHDAVSPVWLVLPDPFSSRLFFDTGIVERLRERLGVRLTLVLDAGEQTAFWSERAGETGIIRPDELVNSRVPLPEKVHRRADRWLDDRIGFYP